jgi:hypothetical protein
MRLGKTLALMVEGIMWRVTHQHWLGRRLIEGLGETDENARTIAGIMLAKSGAAAIPVLRYALAQRTNVTEVLTLLGDVGDASVEEELARFASDPDERVARAARDALRVLALRRKGTASPN